MVHWACYSSQYESSPYIHIYAYTDTGPHTRHTTRVELQIYMNKFTHDQTKNNSLSNVSCYTVISCYTYAFMFLFWKFIYYICTVYSCVVFFFFKINTHFWYMCFFLLFLIAGEKLQCIRVCVCVYFVYDR